MCELLGMNANVPTDIRFSFSALAQCGGGTGPHRDGWGIAFYEGRGARAFHDPQPSAHSEIARLLRDYPLKSKIVIAHVRRANRGRVALENTHPFTRELWGRAWTFAHNGQLKGVKKRSLDLYKPIGTTDSEHAFCWLLGQLRARFSSLPSPDALDQALGELCADLGALGVFNVLVSEGRTLYAFCNKKLFYLVRCWPFGVATLIDEDLRVDFSTMTTPNDRVVVVASSPLTRDEVWLELPARTMTVFRNGQLIPHAPKSADQRSAAP